MADPAEPGPTAAGDLLTPICPWCSAPLPTGDAPACPACGAHLVEEAEVVLPGVTAVDPALLAAASAPRRLKRTFGALLVRSDDDEIPPPTEAEMPALARPDLEVRREMLRLELDARLAALQAEAHALESEGAAAGRAGGGPPVDSETAPPESEDAPESGDVPESEDAGPPTAS